MVLHARTHHCFCTQASSRVRSNCRLHKVTRCQASTEALTILAARHFLALHYRGLLSLSDAERCAEASSQTTDSFAACRLQASAAEHKAQSSSASKQGRHSTADHEVRCAATACTCCCGMAYHNSGPTQLQGWTWQFVRLDLSIAAAPFHEPASAACHAMACLVIGNNALVSQEAPMSASAVATSCTDVVSHAQHRVALTGQPGLSASCTAVQCAAVMKQHSM